METRALPRRDETNVGLGMCCLRLVACQEVTSYKGWSGGQKVTLGYDDRPLDRSESREVSGSGVPKYCWLNNLLVTQV